MKKKPSLTKKEKKALQEFKQKLKKELGSDFLELKLFGSKARGDSRQDSDIDVLLIVKRDNSRARDLVADLVVEIIHQYGLYLSVHTYAKKEYRRLNDISTVFMQILNQEAVKL